MTDWVAAVDWNRGLAESSIGRIRSWLPSNGRIVAELEDCDEQATCKLAVSSTHEWAVHLSRVRELERDVFVLVDGIATCEYLGEQASRLPITEQVAMAYSKWGTRVGEHLNGQWSLLVVDVRQRQVLIWRDAGGTRPVYVRRSGTLWLFSNSSRRLALARGLPRCSVNEASVIDFMVGIFPGESSNTMFRDVCCLEPGCQLILCGDRMERKTWWQPTPWNTSVHLNPAEQFECYRDALQVAVRDSFGRSKHPHIALSGGVDSTSIAVVSKILSDKEEIPLPQGVSVRFPHHPKCDEYDAVREFSDSVGLQVSFVEPADHEKVLRETLDSDHPLVTLYGPPVYACARSVTERDGDLIGIGTLGDLLGGAPSRWTALYDDCESDASSSLQPYWHRVRVRLRELRTLGSIIGIGLPANRMFSLRDWSLRAGRHVERTPRTTNRIERHELWQRVAPCGARAEQAYRLRSVGDSETTLTLYDKFGLPTSRPFLDRRVIEASLSLGTSWRFRQGLNRWVLRQLTKDVTPDRIRLSVRKVAFGSYYRDYWSYCANAHWDEARPELMAYGLSNNLPLRGGQLRFRSIGIALATGLWLRELRHSGTSS